MKPIFLLFILLLLISCSKEKAIQPIEKTSTKTIDFLVYTLQDFSDPRFNNLKVSIDLSVKKLQRKDRTLTTVLWDTALIERPIKEYPYTLASALKISKKFPGINDGTEQLNVVYSIRSVRGNQPPSYSTLITRIDTGNKKQVINVVP